MNLLSVDRIVHALLYEGYILYPYRASSVKNRYAEAQSGADACTMPTETELPGESGGRRKMALPYSLISTHTVLGIEDGDFVSLLDPPSELRQAASECRNEGEPESPGDLFDSAEIDEILTLRLLTMSDQEKQEACRIDEHGRRILQRAELLDAEQFSKLHGTFRGVGISS
jgi:hypothetical protein